MNIKLSPGNDAAECQVAFEYRLVGLMLVKPGALSVNEHGTRYLNEHIQWLWEIWQKEWRDEDSNCN